MKRNLGPLLPEVNSRHRRTIGQRSLFNSRPKKFRTTKKKKGYSWGSTLKKPLYGIPNGSLKNCPKKVCTWVPYKQSCVNRPVTECSGSTPVQTCKKKCENVYYCTSCPLGVTPSTTTTSLTTVTSSRPTPPPDVVFTTPSFVSSTQNPQPPAPPILPIGPPGILGQLPAGEEVLPPSPPVGPVISPPGNFDLIVL